MKKIFSTLIAFAMSINIIATSISSEIVNSEVLVLENLGITDVQLAEMISVGTISQNIVELWLNDNKITDITPLLGLTSLEYLNLSNNQIEDISVLENLPNLWVLVLNSNQISDVSSLSELSNLWYLGLNNNQITNLNPLYNLSGLNRLQILDNLAQWSDVQSLRSALPSCWIESNVQPPIVTHPPVTTVVSTTAVTTATQAIITTLTPVTTQPPIVTQSPTTIATSDTNESSSKLPCGCVWGVDICGICWHMQNGTCFICREENCVCVIETCDCDRRIQICDICRYIGYCRGCRLIPCQCVISDTPFTSHLPPVTGTTNTSEQLPVMTTPQEIVTTPTQPPIVTQSPTTIATSDTNESSSKLPCGCIWGVDVCGICWHMQNETCFICREENCVCVIETCDCDRRIQICDICRYIGYCRGCRLIPCQCIISDIPPTPPPLPTTGTTNTSEQLPVMTTPQANENQGNRFMKGHVLNNQEITIFDGIEILKYIVGIDSEINKSEYAFNASLITSDSQKNGEPTIFDFVEILKYIVKIPSIVLK